MGLANLQAGVVVRIAGQETRVLGTPDNKSWQFENIRTRHVQQMSSSEFLGGLEKGTIAFASATPSQVPVVVKDVLSEAELRTAKVRLAYVRPLLGEPLSKTGSNQVIRQVWDGLRQPSKPPCLSSVRRWIHLYRTAGKDLRALIDQTHRKGNRSARYPAEVVQAVDEAIAIKCLRRTPATLGAALGEARLRVIELNDERLAQFQLPLPTRRLLTRRYNLVPAIERYAARNGQDAARRHFRSVKGHRVAEHPLQRAELDHTLLDIFIIDASGHPLGRPYLTLALDAFSRCVLGYYVGFTPPSYLTVAKCLKNAIHPKVALVEADRDIKNEWPCFGVMTELSVDNGVEFHSSALEQACGSLGIEVHYSPRKEPWGKGKIERFLGTLNRDLCHSIPGSTFANIFEKGDYDAAKKATITLATLKKLLLKWIVDVYHQTLHTALGTTPAAMWTSSISLEDIPFPDESVNFDLIMGRPYNRRLTHKGIEFEGLLYNSPDLQELRKARGATLDVEIRVDEDDLSAIYLIYDRNFAPYKVPALLKSYAEGLSLWKHNVNKNYIARTIKSDVNERSLLEARRDLSDLVNAQLTSRKARSGRRLARYSDANDDAGVGGGGQQVAVAPESGSHSEPIKDRGPKASSLFPPSEAVPQFRPERRKEA